MNTKSAIRSIIQTLVASSAFWAATLFAIPPLGTDANPTSFPVQLFLHNGPITNATGSGVYFLRGTNVYLATAKHVLFNQQDQFHASELACVSYPARRKETNNSLLNIDLRVIGLGGNVRYATNGHDVAALRIGKVNHPHVEFSTGVTLVPQDASSPMFLSDAWCQLFDDVEPGTPVFVFGFPQSLGIPTRPQFDSHRPLLRGGIVAGTFPARKTFVVDAAVYPGNSGGPVVAVIDEAFTRRFFLVGIVTEFVPAVEIWKNEMFQYQNLTMSNSGYSVVEPIDFLMEITK
jgi:hypothetical protein